MSKMKIAAIEFGTSKIVAVVGRDSGDRIRIDGSGTVPYDGYQNGDWNTPGQMIQRVRDAIAAAELESRSRITELYVGVPGEYVRVRSAESMIEVTGEAITSADMEAVQDTAAEELHIADLGGMVLHRSPAWYQVDDGPRTMEPQGYGKILKARTSFIVADDQFISDITEILGELNITILGFLSSTLGEARLLIPVEERDRTAVLIDSGYLSTEISVLRGEALIYHAMLPMGGGYFTADIAETFRIPMRSAEQIKRKFAFNADQFAEEDRPDIYDASGRKMKIPQEDINACVEKTMKELCNMIDMTLSNDVDELLGARSQVYLTGGGLKMSGAREYLESKIGKPIVKRSPRAGKLSTEVFDSVQGLLDITLESIDDHGVKKNDGFASKMTGFMKKK